MIKIDCEVMPDNTDSEVMPDNTDSGVRAEKALWASVLLLAVRDYQYKWGKGKNMDFWRRNAERWFASDSTGRGSFLWVCEHLGLYHLDIRQRVFDRPIRKMAWAQLDREAKRARKRAENGLYRAKKKAQKQALADKRLNQRGLIDGTTADCGVDMPLLSPGYL